MKAPQLCQLPRLRENGYEHTPSEFFTLQCCLLRESEWCLRQMNGALGHGVLGHGALGHDPAL